MITLKKTIASLRAGFDPTLCGDIRTPIQQTTPLPLDIRKLIGRMVCRYLYENCVINLGTGIPNDVIGSIIQEENATKRVDITVESGFGGVQAGGIDFGIGRNLSAMISHQDQMLYYNGAGVDITYMGAGNGCQWPCQCDVVRQYLPWCRWVY